MRVVVNRSDVLFFLMAVALMAVPASYEPHHFAKALLLGSVVQSAAWCVLLTVVTAKSRWLRLVVFSLLLLLFATETYLYCQFDTRFSPNILTLLLQTSGREAAEFAATYLFRPLPLLLFAVLVAVVIVYALYLKRRQPVPLVRQWPARMLAMLMVVVGIAFPYLPLPFPVGQNTLNELWLSAQFVRQSHGEVRLMETMIPRIEITSLSAESDSLYVVFVVGESHNRHHSHLYGYYLPTSPRMDGELARGNLVVFTQALSPTNGTSYAMRYLFSLKGCEDSGKEEHACVLMPAVFRKAGFRVGYFDNQYTRTSGGSLDYSCSYFLGPQYINDHCFDVRNQRIYSHDGEMVSHESRRFPNEPKSLNIIHLMGQHFDARLRFPDSASRFTAGDIKRKDLSEGERQQVADYDNATRYNDAVLGRIVDLYRRRNAVVVYVSDHGEQVYEGENKYFGRSFGSEQDAITKDNVYHVPMMVWCSDSYIRRNAAAFHALQQAADRPLCTADLPYLLFGLAGLECNFSVPERNILYSGYKPHHVHYE